MNNIILIGMPACGKSTIGVVLAKTVGKGYVDTDLQIQQQAGATLQKIIDKYGNDYFYKLEEKVLLNVNCKDSVIATGGSAVYSREAMEKFRGNDIIVYIKVRLNTVTERLDNIKTRGVTLKKGQTLEELYNERTPLYEQYADITVEGDDLTIEQVVEKICDNALI